MTYLACQFTDIFILYLAFSCPLYPLFLLMNTWYFFLLIYTWFSDFSRSFQTRNDPVLQKGCSSPPLRCSVKTGTESCSKCFQSALFHCSSVLWIRYGLFAGSVFSQRKRRKKGERNLLKCCSTSIWFLILSCMYFITLCFRGAWS